MHKTHSQHGPKSRVLSTNISSQFAVRIGSGHRLGLLAVILSTGILLSGCVPLLVGSGAAGIATIVSDRRNPSMQLTDKAIAINVGNNISGALVPNTTRVNVTSFNQRVLLTGEVASEADKAKAVSIAKGVKDVREVLDQLLVGPVASFQTRANDSWITSKIKTELLTTKSVPSGAIEVTTSQGVVYLMGLLNPQEAELAANSAAEVSGVQRVVKAFDLLSASNNPSTPVNSNKNSSNASGLNSQMQTYPLK